MWYGKQASPTSSTSTVDQQEIIFDETSQSAGILPQGSSIYQTVSGQRQAAHAQANVYVNNIHLLTPANNTTSTPSASGTRGRQPGTGRGTKRARTTNSQYAKTNGLGGGGASGATTGKTGSSSINNSNKSTAPKKPKLYNLSQQLTPWKALQHHFLRHSDVKYRPEKRMTMAELGNEVLQRRNGWKVHHLVGQLTDLIQNEAQNRRRITSLLDLFVEKGAKRVHDLANNCHKLPEQYATILQSQRSYGKNEFNPELIATKLDDLLRGDIQRSNLFDDQLNDCRDLIVRITNEHRDRVSRITTKFNKRIQL